MSTDTNTGTKTKKRSAVRQQGDQLTADKETVMSADTASGRSVQRFAK